jgi:hypothetical protein
MEEIRQAVDGVVPIAADGHFVRAGQVGVAGDEADPGSNS